MVTFGPGLLVADVRNQISAVNKTSDLEAVLRGMIKINACLFKYTCFFIGYIKLPSLLHFGNCCLERTPFLYLLAPFKKSFRRK